MGLHYTTPVGLRNAPPRHAWGVRWPICMLLLLCVNTEADIVSTPNGNLRCAFVGNNTRQCLGIPFAAAPVGDLRWRPPQRSVPWQGVRDATQLQPVCVQADRLPTPGAASEDCLYLNVYASRTHSPGGSPVVVWIHGGSYATGSPQNATSIVDLAQDIVWVGINYRMNVFGFLGADQLRYRDTEGSTGNYGLQDQRMALQWVHENIAAFGGDPNKVTIDGCSAGAGSTANHIVNKKSWPFFNQAAGQSGIAAQWNTNTMTQSQAFFDTLAGVTQCGSVDCLLNLSTVELASAAMQTVNIDTGPLANNAIPYAPTVDGVDVLAPPIEFIIQGHIFNGSILLGTAKDECCSLDYDVFEHDLTFQEFQADTLQDYGLYDINVSRVVDLYHGHSDSVNYSQWWWAAIEQSSDYAFHCPARMAARLFSQHGNPVFQHSFRIPSLYKPDLTCVPHCSELAGYLFDGIDIADPNIKTYMAMAQYLISFWKHGDPSISHMEGSPVWPDHSNGEILVFASEQDGGIHTETDLRTPWCNYWETLPGLPCALKLHPR